MATDPDESGPAIEARIRDLVIDLKRIIRIPLAVKLGPFFTAFGNVARQLDKAGADGLVIFNRFYQPDVDVETLATVPRVELSTSAELLLRLRWLAALHGRVRCSLAVTGGVAAPIDGIKAILAGADAVQLVSAILRNGPGYFAKMRDGLAEWLEGRGSRRSDRRAAPSTATASTSTCSNEAVTFDHSRAGRHSLGRDVLTEFRQRHRSS